MRKFPVYVQQGSFDCGPTCLLMVASYYGKNAVIETNAEDAGATMAALAKDAEKSGFDVRNVRVVQFHFDALSQLQLPAIAHWIESGRAHWVVITEIVDGWIYVADPGWPFGGMRRFSRADFINCWDGILMLLSPRK